MTTLRNHHLYINTGHFNSFILTSHFLIHIYIYPNNWFKFYQQQTYKSPLKTVLCYPRAAHTRLENPKVPEFSSLLSSIRLIIILISNNNSGMKSSSNISFFYSGIRFTNKLTKNLPGWLSLSLINRCQARLLQAQVVVSTFNDNAKTSY